MVSSSIDSRPFTWNDTGDPLRVLRGAVDRPRNAANPLPVVLVLHGFKGFFRWGFFPLLGRRLAEAGFAAVRFNFSGSGVGADLESFTEDAAFEANSPARELDDAVRLLEALRAGRVPGVALELGAPIGLVGHSMGGAVALLLAGGAAPVAVGATVTWASVASFDRFTPEEKERFHADGWLPIPNARTGQVHRVGRAWLEDIESGRADLDPLAACARVTTPTLLLHGQDDGSVPLAEAEALAAALPAGVGRLETLAGAGHTFGAIHPPAAAVPEALERVLERTLTHLRTHLVP